MPHNALALLYKAICGRRKITNKSIYNRDTACHVHKIDVALNTVM